MKKEWFSAWFGSAYQKIYTHRDTLQAEAQVKMLFKHLKRLEKITLPSLNILDIGCGSGRHLSVLKKMGCKAFGLDLSSTLLREARREKLPVLRADMRYLPFATQSFDLITSFFTSFGYFQAEEDDKKALHGFVSLMRPQGFLFLDLMNADFVKANLVAEESTQLAEMRVLQKRRLEGRKVTKEIHILYTDGREEKHTEQVNLYSQQEMKTMLNQEGLKVEHIFGNECGETFANHLPRMSLLCRRV